MGPVWWAARGLVTVTGDQVQAAVQLRCYQGLVVAFDFHRRGGAALAPDYVMGISASSITLAGLTIRRPSRATLDLGTGSGFQAFVASRHSDRVVATDRNPRAVEMATFNARVNGLSHVDCRLDDLFEPVEGETFDMIVSNPPFIISPDNIFLFLHSGMTGDEVCRTIAREAPALLSEDGYCQFLANWTVVSGEDWRDRLAGWFDGTSCDALVLRRGSTAPDEYAAIWIESEEGGDRIDESFDAWMAYYDGMDVQAIDSGLITMRRSASSATPWFRAEDTPETMTFPAGRDVHRRFEAEDFLAATRRTRPCWRPRSGCRPTCGSSSSPVRSGTDGRCWAPTSAGSRACTGSGTSTSTEPPCSLVATAARAWRTCSTAWPGGWGLVPTTWPAPGRGRSAGW